MMTDFSRRLTVNASTAPGAPGAPMTLQHGTSGHFLDAHLTDTHDYRAVTRPWQGNDTQRWLMNAVGYVHVISLRRPCRSQERCRATWPCSPPAVEPRPRPLACPVRDCREVARAGRERAHPVLARTRTAQGRALRAAAASSREEEQLERLKRNLAIYRVVFGQPRQAELTALINGGGISQSEIDSWVVRLEPGG